MGGQTSQKYLNKVGIVNQLLVASLMIVITLSQCPGGTTGYNCASCPTGCDTCDTSATICDACSLGYYISGTSCIACPLNCLKCDTPTYCIGCIPGYDATTNAAGEEQCEFKWWKWFLIIFGILLGIFLLGLLIYWLKKKLSQEDNQNKEVEYQMRMETTEENVHD